MSALSQSQRAAYARWKPVADQTEADLAAWLADHRLPGEGVASARRRWSALRRTKFKRAITAHLHFARSHKSGLRQKRHLRGYVPLGDDGLTDEAWAALNLQREYRIRPHRYSDGEPEIHRFPCMSIYHRPSNTWIKGAPVDILQIGDRIYWPTDTDEFCELLFVVASQTDGFQKRAVGTQ